MATFEQLGPYVVQQPLGSGGMGTVFLGVDKQTGERTAIKVLAPGLAADPNFRERFRTEVETLKKLKHPNIVQLLGYGEQDGHLFYAMEMVDGRTLQEELQAGRRFSWREVSRIAVQVCQALKHAHDRGIIHRDLKPANLLYTEDEHVKLADFGIAKLYGMAQLTSAGGVLGTADYMSPEQAEGKPVTSRSDIYSLGGVLFALLAGRPPFASRSVAEVIHKLRYDEAVPVRRLAPDTPAEFELIIAQMLRKQPEERIATALAASNRIKAMEFGLSMETRMEGSGHSASAVDDGSYELAGGYRGTGGDMVTSAPTTGMPAASDGSDFRQQHAKATVAMPGPGEPVADPNSGVGNRGTHFTTYDEEARARAIHSTPSEDAAPTWWIVALGGLAVAFLVLAVWYFRRPPSAETLLGQIMEVAKDADASDLVPIEDKINDFLARFPQHAQTAEVRSLRDDLDLYRLQRRYERRTKLRGGTESFGLIERAYVRAMRLAETDPNAAALEMQAVLDVYAGAPLDETSEQCVNLAREQLDRLHAKVTPLTVNDLATLQERLDAADLLAPDDAARASAIRRGIVLLYGDTPWARPAVDRARAALDAELPQESPARL